ncbi:hypothetical protein GUJ93_ZPchr0005g15841 [Zizania palustris]|uniref:Uncharacterized protein n=1 Tax=Zizania palustris TaxID=103762 RepID=A0A8J5SBC4_ZIZPA|nr:hypothetical protein GUJ93_ZPchr0005g15841 [Zizania palustris]
MTMFVSTAEDIQVLANLQQAVANLRVYLGLAPVASTLPSFFHGATGFPTVSSPPPQAATDSRRATGESLNPVLIKKVADQQGKVTLVGSSVDDAFLTTNKRAMEQGALIALLPVAEAEAQGAERKGDAATGQTLAKLSLPPPWATSTLDTRPVIRKSKQPWARYAVKIWDSMKDPIWLATPRAPNSPLSHMRLLSRTEGCHHQLPRGLPVPPTEQRRSPTWRRRLRWGECGGGDIFEGGRAPSRWLRRGTTVNSKRTARPVVGFGGERWHLRRGSAGAAMTLKEDTRPVGSFGGGWRHPRRGSRAPPLILDWDNGIFEGGPRAASVASEGGVRGDDGFQRWRGM